jgi:hypothetical protein
MVLTGVFGFVLLLLVTYLVVNPLAASASIVRAQRHYEGTRDEKEKLIERIGELEMDFATGNISAEDYERLRQVDMQKVADLARTPAGEVADGQEIEARVQGAGVADGQEIEARVQGAGVADGQEIEARVQGAGVAVTEPEDGASIDQRFADDTIELEIAARKAVLAGRKCPRCGAPREMDDLFCRKCGADLAAKGGALHA